MLIKFLQTIFLNMRNLIILLAISIATISCKEDDSNLEVIPTFEELGVWHLVNVNGGLAGVQSFFEPGTITWDFVDTQVTITNTNTDDSLVDLFESGVYAFSVGFENGHKTLTVDELNLGALEISPDILNVDQRVVDGFQFIFIKL